MAVAVVANLSLKSSYGISMQYVNVETIALALEDYFRFRQTGSTINRRRPTFNTALKQSRSD